MDEERIIEIAFDESVKGMRLDKALSLMMPGTSRSAVQKHIEEGRVFLDGEMADSKKYIVSGKEKVTVELPEPEILEVKAQNIPLDIVYEDDDVLVVNKPKGMVVHPAAGNPDGTLVNAVMYHCGDSLSSINGVVRPGIVHRIDKDTSGLLMIAKNDAAHNSLAAQLAEHSITRKYTAVVYNNFKEDEGTVDEPIGRDPKNRQRQCVIYTNSREAVTHYRVIERFGKYTLVECVLETGRTHQIRVHMAYIKHPLLGDELYGPAKNPYGVKGQMLHAGVLGFVHPKTSEYMEFERPAPDKFLNIVEKIRKENR
ncbi:MAG: RluA family pseudouridine synthase [Firmicutes bacterium]|nr:RluA family pseudouridine synthase [Bacillota bacterium]